MQQEPAAVSNANSRNESATDAKITANPLSVVVGNSAETDVSEL